jgi:hypothetical protein
MSNEQNTTNESGVVNTNPVIVGLDITTKIAAIAGRKMNTAN